MEPLYSIFNFYVWKADIEMIEKSQRLFVF